MTPPQNILYREIALTKGKVAIVDADLYERFTQHKYSALQTRYPGKFYAVRRSTVGDKVNYIYMHREILGLLEDDHMFADHINGDTLDNRRENLRPATRSENVRNQRKHKDNRTGFKGVAEYCKWRWATGVPKWSASIYYDGKLHHLGVFLSPEEAHNAYCARAKEIHGEFFNKG